jgi:hypothetical protein
VGVCPATDVWIGFLLLRISSDPRKRVLRLEEEARQLSTKIDCFTSSGSGGINAMTKKNIFRGIKMRYWD